MERPLYVLITTHGRPTLLPRTLGSLAACTLPVSYREAVVVENGSRGGAEQVVAEFAERHPALRLRYTFVEWGNKSNALNRALASIGDGLVVFFDDDVRLAPNVLEVYSAAAAPYERGAVLGSSCGVDYDGEPPEWLRPHLPPSARGLDLTEHGGLYLGFNWAAFAEDIRQVGGFDPSFGPGSATGATGQERNMQERLVEAGAVRVDIPTVLVWHYVPEERCSPRWAARRQFRSAAETVQRSAASQGEHAFGRALLRGARSALAVPRKFVRGDDEGVWRAVRGLYASAGVCVTLLRMKLRRP